MDNEKIAAELVKLAKELVAESRIDILDRIVENKQYEKIDGQNIDLTTANMLRTLYNALKPELQRNFEKIPIRKLVQIGWTVMK